MKSCFKRFQRCLTLNTVVRPDVGRRCLIIHMGAVKYETLLHLAYCKHMNREQRVAAMRHRIYCPIQMHRSLYSSLLRIACVWVTPHKADGRSTEISFVHFLVMYWSHECVVSDEMILTKSIEITWSNDNNSFITGLVMREHGKINLSSK